MGKLPYVLVSVSGAILLILGGACIARAIIPREWGRWAYVVTIVAVVLAIAISQVIR